MNPRAARFGAPVIEPAGSVATRRSERRDRGPEPARHRRLEVVEVSEGRHGPEARDVDASRPRRRARDRSGSGRRSSGARRRPSPTRGARRGRPASLPPWSSGTVPLIGARGDPPGDGGRRRGRARASSRRPPPRRSRRRSRTAPGCRLQRRSASRRGGISALADDPPGQVRLVDVAPARSPRESPRPPPSTRRCPSVLRARGSARRSVPAASPLLGRRARVAAALRAESGGRRRRVRSDVEEPEPGEGGRGRPEERRRALERHSRLVRQEAGGEPPGTSRRGARRRASARSSGELVRPVTRHLPDLDRVAEVERRRESPAGPAEEDGSRGHARVVYGAWRTGRWVETAVKVRYAETDAQGVVYHGSYVVWFEVGRTEYCEAPGTPTPGWRRRASTSS